MKILIKQLRNALYILSTPLRIIICKHEWECNGWTTVKCGKCEYVSHDMNKAGEIIKNRIDKIDQTPSAHTTQGLKDTAKLYYGDFDPF